MIDLATEFGSYVDKRLRNELVIWLTTVTPGGEPQPNPVWFYWDGEAITIYSQPESYRIRNIRHHSRVTLNLQGVGVMGEDVVIIHGEAKLKHNYPALHPEYRRKYDPYILKMDMTPAQMTETYSVEITIRPAKVRT